MDILKKHQYSLISKAAKEFQSRKIYPYFRAIEEVNGTVARINDKEYLMLGSNSYLGLTTDKRVIKEAKKATDHYGTGNAGSRFLNGTLDIHVKLEQKVAELVNKEDAILFSTGYQTNLGVISALVDKDDYVITDKADHASIIDGCKLSNGTMMRFDHQNMSHLEKVLRIIPEDKGKLIVVDGVYSMEGDIAKLPEIVFLAKKYGAKIMVDDAHGIGMIGKGGRGTVSYWESQGKIKGGDVDVVTGTFSKSLASLGGFCASSHEVIHYLKHASRSLIFSASMTPGSTAAVLMAISIMLNEPERIMHLHEISIKMRNALHRMNFQTGLSETAIIPIIIGGMEETFQFWRLLTERGLFVNPAVPPAVPLGKSLIRTSLMAIHTETEIDVALEIIEQSGRELGII